MTLFAAKTKRQAEPAEPQTRPRRKLTRAERKQIEAAIARANRTGKKEQSAQDSIPYERMWPDGICKVADGPLHQDHPVPGHQLPAQPK